MVRNRKNERRGIFEFLVRTIWLYNTIMSVLKDRGIDDAEVFGSF